jgi:hypothetical protein
MCTIAYTFVSMWIMRCASGASRTKLALICIVETASRVLSCAAWLHMQGGAASGACLLCWHPHFLRPLRWATLPDDLPEHTPTALAHWLFTSAALFGTEHHRSHTALSGCLAGLCTKTRLTRDVGNLSCTVACNCRCPRRRAACHRHPGGLHPALNTAATSDRADCSAR